MRSLRRSSAAMRVSSAAAWAVSSALDPPSQPLNSNERRPAAATVDRNTMIEPPRLVARSIERAAKREPDSPLARVDEGPRGLGHLVENAVGARATPLQHVIAVVGRVEPVQLR